MTSGVRYSWGPCSCYGGFTTPMRHHNRTHKRCWRVGGMGLVTKKVEKFPAHVPEKLITRIEEGL